MANCRRPSTTCCNKALPPISRIPNWPKHYNRCRQFDKALSAAQAWVAAAGDQAGLHENWLLWQSAPGYALAALKGLAFILLRNGQPAEAEAAIARVLAMDPDDGVGGSVIAALIEETLVISYFGRFFRLTVGLTTSSA